MSELTDEVRAEADRLVAISNRAGGGWSGMYAVAAVVEGLRAELAEAVPLAQHIETQEALGMARTTIAELRRELAALRAAGGQEKPTAVDGLRAFAEWVVSLDEPGNRERQTVTLTNIIIAAERALAAPAGGQEKPTSCGMGCEAGVNVQCVEHGPKWPVRAPVGGQAPSDEPWHIDAAQLRRHYGTVGGQAEPSDALTPIDTLIAELTIDNADKLSEDADDLVRSVGYQLNVSIPVGRAIVIARCVASWLRDVGYFDPVAAVSGEQAQPDGENDARAAELIMEQLLDDITTTGSIAFRDYFGERVVNMLKAEGFRIVAAGVGGGRPTGTDNEGGQR